MAVAFLNAGTPKNQAGASFSSAFSVNTGGTNVVAFAVVAWDNTAGLSISAITYGGQTMLSCGAAVEETNNDIYVQAFYLADPPTGSNTLAITGVGGVNEIYANLVAFTGVNKDTPVRPGTYNTSHGGLVTTISLVVTSNVNDLTLSFISSSSGLSTTNQTSDGVDTGGNNSLSSDHATTAAASVTHTWSGGSGGHYSLAGFSIQAASDDTVADVLQYQLS